jgi:hypothetical protein
MKSWLFSPEVMYIMKAIANSSFIEEERNSFRVSSLPYCPIYDIYSTFKVTRQKKFTESFYTEIGTAVHNAIQNHLFKIDPAVPFGNWQCKNVLEEKTSDSKLTSTQCTYTLPMCSLKDALKKHKCPHKKKDCKKHLTYKEIEVKWKNLSGHIDTVFKYKGKTILVDYKTTSNWLFNSGKTRPADKYIEQIETYAFLLKVLFKINVDVIAIVYIAREKSMSASEMPIKIYARKLNKQFYNKRKKTSLKYNRLFTLRKKIGFPGNLKNKNMDAVIESRPCKSKQDYDKTMLKKFEASQEDCPMLQSCIKGRSAIIHHLKTI